MFAQAREAAGLSRLEVDGATVGQVLDLASADLGTHFAAVLESCAVWVNGEPADRDVAVAAADEVAVLPPVSGGAA
jgi:molybdopterin converting factor small subunit